MTFIARYTGTECGSCGERVREGQEVAYNASDDLVHAACPEAPDDVRRDACPRCFLELPVSGVCGECS